MSKYQLGYKAKDKITGFSGIITGYANYLTGCDQYLIQPQCENPKDYPAANWFDEGRIEQTGYEIEVAKEDVQGEEPGACGSAPIK